MSELDIRNHYVDLFSGKGDLNAAYEVLDDLAEVSGFYTVAGQGTDSEQLQYREGQRSVYARIFAFLNWSDAELEMHQQRARRNALSNAGHLDDYHATPL